MPNNHLITKNYLNLSGYSTNSIYYRSPNISTVAENLYRYPDGTLSPRRGYQAQLAAIGGLGCSTYKNPLSQVLEVVCLNYDGNLYDEQTNTLTISYSGTRLIQLSIITDERYTASKPPGYTQNGSITAQLIGSQYAIVNGLQTGVTLIVVEGGLTVVPGDVIQYYDYIAEAFLTQTVIATGAFTILVANPVNVLDQSPINVIFMDQPFGVGYDDIPIFTIANFVTAINLVTDFTATLSAGANTTVPAAFLHLVEPVNITAAQPYTWTYYNWVKLHSTIATPVLPGSAANINSPYFENATFANFDGVLYVSNGYDYPVKYDGLSVYLAGMPAPSQPQVAIAGAGNLTGTYRYDISYEFIDAQGHLIESALSPVSNPDIVVVGNEINVTVADLVGGSGYNTDGAIVNGNQMNVSTIAVNGGQTLIAGDSAYFLESPTAVVNGPQVNVNLVNVNAGNLAFVGEELYFSDAAGVEHTRTVLAVSPLTIKLSGLPLTFAGGEVFSSYRTFMISSVTGTSITLAPPTNPLEPAVTNVLNGSPISNNLKINIYRNINGGTSFYLVASIPNNAFSTYQIYTDNLNDVDLEANLEYDQPVQIPGTPPKAKYIYCFINQLIYGGTVPGVDGGINEDAIYFSNEEDPENVPPASNFFILPAGDDVVSGINESANTLIIGKNRSFYSITGVLSVGQFKINPISPGANIGCASNAAMKSVGELLYILHTNGVYSMDNAQFVPVDRNGIPIPISKDIDLLFREFPVEQNQRFVLLRSTAINYTKDNMYLLFLPCENSNATARVANASSIVLAWDYQNKDWYVWNNINAAGGFYISDDNLYWQERRRSGFIGNTANTYRQHRRYRLIDQADHVFPINVAWTSSWEDLGYPRVRKKFIRAILLFDRILPIFQSNVPTLNFFSCIDRVPDLQHTQATATLTPENGSAEWSLTPWSWSQWSSYSDSFLTFDLRQGTQAKSMQIGFTMAMLNTSFRFQGFQMEIAPDFRKTVVK